MRLAKYVAILALFLGIPVALYATDNATDDQQNAVVASDPATAVNAVADRGDDDDDALGNKNAQGLNLSEGQSNKYWYGGWGGYGYGLGSYLGYGYGLGSYLGGWGYGYPYSYSSWYYPYMYLSSWY